MIMSRSTKKNTRPLDCGFGIADCGLADEERAGEEDPDRNSAYLLIRNPKSEIHNRDMPKDVDTKPLEETFRVRVIKMLVDEDLLSLERAENLLSWKNSGFSVHVGEPIRPDQPLALERVARYIIRNTLPISDFGLRIAD